MAIKHSVTRGFATLPGSIKYAVTAGYISGAEVIPTGPNTGSLAMSGVGRSIIPIMIWRLFE